MEKNRKILMEKSKRIQLAALSITRGMQSGCFRSYFRGNGVEFDSLREYEYGDDIRSIDWNLMARSGKAFVKLYHENKDFRFFVIIDVSKSMETAYGEKSALYRAMETAALLIFAAEKAHGHTGMIAFDGKVVHHMHLDQSSYSASSIVRELEKAADGPKSTGSVLNAALVTAAKTLRQRTLVFIISDFKIAGYGKELGMLAQKHDVVTARVVTESDLTLPEAGVLRFKDPETGIERLLPTSSPHFKELRQRHYTEWTGQWVHMCVQCGAIPLELPPNTDTVPILNHFFLYGKHAVRRQRNRPDSNRDRTAAKHYRHDGSEREKASEPQSKASISL